MTTTRSIDTTTAPPATGTAALRVLALGAAVAVVNLAVYGLGSLAGADWVVDNGGTLQDVPVGAVVAASFVPLGVAAVVLFLAAPRRSWVSRAWAPVVVVIGLHPLLGLTGAADAVNQPVPGVMHLVVAGVAAFVLPGRLAR